MRILILLLFLTSEIVAQKFVAEGSLPTVARDGFYRVAIDPEAAAFASASFANLRIVDDAGKETPYILEEEVMKRCNRNGVLEGQFKA